MRLRKIMSGFLAAALGVGMSAAVVFAAPSASAAPSVVNEENGSDRYVTSDLSIVESYKELKEALPEVGSAIDAILAAQTGADGSKSVTDTLIEELQKLSEDGSVPASVSESAKEVAEKIADKKQAATGMFDLDRTGEDVRKADDGKYLVTLKIPSLTKDTTGVQVLHFSAERQVWELIDPESVDLDRQEVTVVFEDLGPVMILCDKGTVSTIADMDQNAKSPKTADTTGRWIGYAAAAVVLACAAGLVLRRKKA